jgi:hypothetical protein
MKRETERIIRPPCKSVLKWRIEGRRLDGSIPDHLEV